MPDILSLPYGRVDEWVERSSKHNGVVSVHVINGLTSPSESVDPIFINVYTSACDDLELACPTNRNIAYLRPKIDFPSNQGVDPLVPPVVYDPALDAIYSVFNPGYSLDTLSVTYNPVSSGYAASVLFSAGQFIPINVITYNDTTSNTPIGLLLEAAATGLYTGTVDGVSYELNGIGDTAEITIPKTTVPGINVLNMLTTNSFTARTFIRDTWTSRPADSKRKSLLSSVLIATYPNMTADGSYYWTTTTEQNILIPNHYPGSPVIMVLRTACNVNGQDVTGPTQGATLGCPMLFYPDRNGYLKITPTTATTVIGGIITYLETDPDYVNQSQVVVRDMPGGTSTLGMNQIYFGEQVGSWRQLLKRYSTCMTMFNPTNTTQKFTVPMYPHKLNTDYTLANTASMKNVPNLFEWVVHAYVGVRGSMRYKCIPNTRPGIFAVNRMDKNNVGDSTGVVNVGQGTGVDNNYTFVGSEFWNPALYDTFDFEIPYYSNYRFVRSRTFVSSNPFIFVENDLFNIFTSGLSRLCLACSVGEDFMAAGFISTPVFVPFS